MQFGANERELDVVPRGPAQLDHDSSAGSSPRARIDSIERLATS